MKLPLSIEKWLELNDRATPRQIVEWVTHEACQLQREADCLSLGRSIPLAPLVIPEPKINCKTYLGDGAYASFDGYGITLTTENGVQVTNTIYLEPEVYESLVMFVTKLKEK